MGLPKPRRRPRHFAQKVVAFIGVPGSGKSTLAQELQLDMPTTPVTLTLDDFRQTLWPPNRRVYWDVIRANPESDRPAQALLHRVHWHALDTALYEGFSVILPDTHVNYGPIKRELEIIAEHGLVPEWWLLKVPLETLLQRNKTRPVEHRLPEGLVEGFYNAMWKDDAWWRSIPPEHIKVIENG